MTSATEPTHLTEQDYEILGLFVPSQPTLLGGPPQYRLNEVPTTDNVYHMIQRLQRMGMVETVRVRLNAVDFKLTARGSRESVRRRVVERAIRNPDAQLTLGLTPKQTQALRAFSFTGEDQHRPEHWHCIVFRSGSPEDVAAMQALRDLGLIEEENRAGSTTLYRYTNTGLNLRRLSDRHFPAQPGRVVPPEPTTNHPSLGRERMAFEMFELFNLRDEFGLQYSAHSREVVAQVHMLIKMGYAENVDLDAMSGQIYARLTKAGAARRYAVLTGIAREEPTVSTPPPTPDAQPPQRRIKITKRNI